jgi:ADP-glucose pyrophosphorylase
MMSLLFGTRINVIDVHLSRRYRAGLRCIRVFTNKRSHVACAQDVTEPAQRHDLRARFREMLA